MRRLAERDLVVLDWTLGGAGGGPRYERWLRLTPDGRAAASSLAAGETPPGRPLGPRQVAALRELLAGPNEGLAGVGLVASHGGSGLTGLIRRGLVEAEVRERPRRPLAGRAPGLRGGRPPSSELSPAQAQAVELATAAIDASDPTPLLLDGVTGGGKTAVYVEAIMASLERGKPALLLVPEIAMALPLVDRIRADLDVRVALVHSGLGDGERADEWRRVRAGDVDVVVGTRLAVLSPLASLGLVVVDEEHDAAYKSDRTPRLQARDVAIRLAAAAGAACVLGSATPAVGLGGPCAIRPLPAGRVARSRGRRRPGHPDRRPARGIGGRRTRAPVAAAGRGARVAGSRRRRPGDPRPQPAGYRVHRPVP